MSEPDHDSRGLNPFPIDGLPIHVCREMEGAKRAVKIGDQIHVSPAMWDLMKHSTQDELRRLLASIEVLDLGPFDIMTQPISISWEDRQS